MSVFKCKMCGGTIEFNPGDTVGVCDSCGTKQTLPRLDDDKKSNLYDRANHFRRNNDFDKAMGIYEQILNEDNTDAEAYWSLVLCRYGIEYVEDPASHKRLPTVNRAQYTSIFADEDYKSAIQYANGYQKAIYEEEAKAIDDIQKGILEISSKEEPFDVFICYKETDANGRRTQDSVLANDLYHQLSAEGFKVFFSRITLEDKLGVAYEPYIFAALNSAKVMVVLGTRPEYFSAVWVKNEWSRYLALVKNSGGKKMLIPAYRNMDPYDLPEEFSHLQAQDMSKLGFMQDLIRGIKKLISANPPKSAAKETVSDSTANTSITPLLERVFLFLEDGNWQDADIYCEKVLDIDPKNAQAYLGKLMVEMRVKNRKLLADCSKPFDNSDNFGKVIRFGDDALKAEMQGYIKHINERNENDRLTEIYNSAVDAMRTASTESAFKKAADTFKSISGFKDSDMLAEQCLEKAEADRLAHERKAEAARIAAKKVVKKLKIALAIGTPLICACVAFYFVWINVIIPNRNYNSAINMINEGKIIEAYDSLIAMDGYKDSAAKASEIYFQYQIEKIRVANDGEIVDFGTYNGDTIRWLVLENKDNKVFLISHYALFCQEFASSLENNTWELSSIRTWLNNDFFNTAFNAEEQALIQNTTLSTESENTTTDKVFLLSIDEAEKYFSSPKERQCEPIPYRITETGTRYLIPPSNHSTDCKWWLRSPGHDQSCTAYVYNTGSVRSYGDSYYCNFLVRPALWIDFES